MKKIFIVLSFVLLSCTAMLAAQPEGQGPSLTDAQLFKVLNLDYPGLEDVRDDVFLGDLETAKHDLVKYLKMRTNPKWFFDWRDVDKFSSRDPKFDTTNADKYASDLLVSCNVWHQFGDTIDWSINPTPLKYNEWTWQLSRHSFWYELGRAYWATGDEKYAQAFVRQLRSWIIQNPVTPDSGNYEYSRWRTIETGIRMLGSWPASYNYFLGSPSMDDDTIILMLKSFYDHAIHLKTFPQGNNWLTMEMNGLFHVGLLFPEFKEAAEWRDFAVDKLYAQEIEQIYPDGAQRELTTHYHLVSVSNFMGIVRYARINGYELPADYVARIEKAYDYLMRVITPEHCIPAVNDSDWNEIDGYLADGHEYYPDHEGFEYVSTKGEKGTKPSFTSAWMPWAGQYAMRSGWNPDDWYCFFEVGPFGAGHQHEDKLSMIISAYGKRLLTEGARYAYDTSQWRKYILIAQAHNLTRVDGKDQNRRATRSTYLSETPLTNRWITNERFDFGEGWYEDGFGPDLDKTVTQYRAMTFVKNRYWLVFDVFSPSDSAEHSYDTWWHFNTDKSAPAGVNAGWTSADATGANLAIIPLRSDIAGSEVICAQEDPEVQGWVPAGDANVYEVRPVATPVFHRKAAGQTVEPYILCPSRSGEAVRVKKIKQKSANEYIVWFKDGSKDVITFSLDGNSLGKLEIKSGKDVITVL